MHIRYFHLYLAGIILLAFSSCEYEPSGENFREIAPPDTTKMIQINLSPFETQYVFTKTANVNYDLNTFGLKIYNVEFFVGDQSIHTGTEATGYFMFQPAIFGRGLKTMTMKVTTSSNTGSLADLLGTEALIYQQTWNIILDGEAPNPVEITKIFNDNGVLKLEWEEYNRINFGRYILYRKFGKVTDQAETKQIASFTDPKQVSFYDYSYTGGNSTYWVVVDGSDQSSIGTKKEINYAVPKLDTLWVKSDSARFVWRKNVFPKAVRQVKLTTPDSYSMPEITLFSSENVNDTCFTVKGLQFGYQANYILSTYPKTEIGLFDNKQILKSELIIGLGKSFPAFTDFICPPSENYVFLWKDDQISKVDLDRKIILSSAACQFHRNWFISNFDGDLYSYFNYEYSRFNKTNLADNKTNSCYNLGFQEFYNPIPLNSNQSLSISTNNRLAGNLGPGLGVYDLTANKLVFSDLKTNIEYVVFSPDGKYCYNISFGSKLGITLYEVTETGLQKTVQLPVDNYGKVIWIPGKEHKLMVLKGYENDRSGNTENSLSIWDPLTTKMDIKFQVKVGYLSGIDLSTNHVAFWSEVPPTNEKKLLYIYNFTTGNLVKTMSISPKVNNLTIYRSQVFSSEGSVFKYTN